MRKFYGLKRNRRWLDGLRQVVSWQQDLFSRHPQDPLRRLKVHYKRGLRYLHSPDPDYEQKMTAIQMALELVKTYPERFVMVYQDELTYYRRPTVAQGYAETGSDEPHARQGLRSNLSRRIAASLNVKSGQLFTWQRKHFDRWTLIRYYQALEELYPDAGVIFIAQDNWPVHFHDDVLGALVDTKIILLPLPTYAPWTNPTEKVWRKLYQEVLHLHDFADRWDVLQQTVTTWLNQFAYGSTDLLCYVGLHPG